MAGIFLSYAHQDRALAAKVAAAFEHAGHRVWWDLHVKAGRRFAEEIADALDQADHVVVLWSRASVKSSWVLDEAAVGRDSGRLIPVTTDDALPPLGFRQYQSLPLRAGAEAGEDDLQSLVSAISGDTPITKPRTAHPAWSRRWIAALLIIVILAGGGIVAWLKPWAAGDAAPTVLIGPSAQSSDPQSRDFAHQVAVDLGRFPVGPLSSLSIHEADPGEKQDATYRSEISLSRAGTNVHADISLFVDGRSGQVWASGIDGTADRLIDLRQHAAANLSDALICALQSEFPGKRLPDDVFRMFLDACTRTGANLDDVSTGRAIETFRQVTRKAPDFALGWAYLALLQSNYFYATPSEQHRALGMEARGNLARARQLDPAMEQGFVAESNLLPRDKSFWKQSLLALDRGLAAHPDSAQLLTMRAERLRDIGRATEAIELMRRATDIEPLTLTLRTGYIDSLAYSGRLDAALAELSRDQKIWPQSTSLTDARFRIDLRYGDPANALRLLRVESPDNLRNQPFDRSWQTFLRARIDPSPANVEASLKSFRDRYRRNPADIPGYLQTLATFGRLDEAYLVTRNPITLDSMFVSTEVLFRQHMRAFRADRRFIDLANRLGLLAYWRGSGKWPDFCAEPDLPYDCRAEAAKYR